MTADPGSIVRLVAVPVDLFLRSEQHTSDLLREAIYVLAHGDAGAGSVYHRLLEAAEWARMRGASSRTETGDRVEAARLRGESAVDVTVPARESVADFVESWTDLLDEMDAECAAGRLLCLPADAELARFRRWWSDQVAGQVRGTATPSAFLARATAAGQSTGS